LNLAVTLAVVHWLYHLSSGFPWRCSSSKQNSVSRLKSNILYPQNFCPSPNFWAGYATGLLYSAFGAVASVHQQKIPDIAHEPVHDLSYRSIDITLKISETRTCISLKRRFLALHR